MKRKIVYTLFKHTMIHIGLVAILRVLGCSWWGALAPTAVVVLISLLAFISYFIKYAKSKGSV